VQSLSRIADTWSRVRPLEGQRRALWVLLGGLLATAIALLALRAHEDDQRRIEFERRAYDLSRSLRTALSLPLETLRLIPPLFDGSDPVTPEEFIGFVGPALARHPGVAYLEWAPEVLAGERASFEKRARELGFERFFIGEPEANGKLAPAPERARYLPLLYIAPRSDPVIGLDLSFEPARRDLALRALSDGVLTVSQQFRLVEDPPDMRSIAAYAPLVRPRHPSVEPHGARRGLAVLIFRIAPLVRAVLGEKLGPLDLALIDETAVGAPELLFETQPGSYRRPDAEFEAAFAQPFEFHTRHWRVRFFATPGSLPKRLLSPIVGALGVLLSIAGAFMIGAFHLVRRLRTEVQAAQQIGQYRLVRKLGEGGMGTVYEAEHALLRRPTAVKVISAHAVGQDAIERFEREVKTTSQLTHPNTVAVFDYGRAPSGVFYYAMEFLPGANVEQLVRRTGPLPAARVVHLLQQVCGSLAEAHEAGLVHRDIKPANLMVCERGGISDFVKVLDFGLVKDVRQQASSLAGTIVGTPHYMAPEIVLGMGASAATDLYALGAVAYFMLTAYEVFPERALLAVLAQHVSEVPPPPSQRAPIEVPAGLDALVLRCLAKKAEQRPGSARELAQALEQLVSDGAVEPWTQDAASAFWRAHRDTLDRVSSGPASEAGITPWGETLVVDLGERGRAQLSVSDGEVSRRLGG
jgi:serine/threonine protein kinase/CHASE1-domain containing sensor protein